MWIAFYSRYRSCFQKNRAHSRRPWWSDSHREVVDLQVCGFCGWYLQTHEGQRYECTQRGAQDPSGMFSGWFWDGKSPRINKTWLFLWRPIRRTWWISNPNVEDFPPCSEKPLRDMPTEKGGPKMSKLRLRWRWRAATTVIWMNSSEWYIHTVHIYIYMYICMYVGVNPVTKDSYLHTYWFPARTAQRRWRKFQIGIL